MPEKFDKKETGDVKPQLDAGKSTKDLGDVGKASMAGHTGMSDAKDTKLEARRAAETALENNPSTKNSLIDARRHASEAAAKATIGGDAVNLDEKIQENENLKFKGNNYPGDDISSSTELASVKTHWKSDMSWNPADYKKDLYNMMGWGKEVKALDEDAKNLEALEKANVPIPDELKNSSHEEKLKYARDKTTLRIPDDHVAETKDVISEDFDKHPDYYHGLSKEEVISRIKNIGLSSSELQEIIDAHTDDTNLNPPGGLKDLNTRGGHPLPKVVDTPHVIEHYEGSINLEDGLQESGVTRIPPEAKKQIPKEDKEGKPGSLNWRGGGGIEKGG